MKSETTLNATQKRKRIFRLGLDGIALLFANKEKIVPEIRAFLSWIERPKYHSNLVVWCPL